MKSNLNPNGNPRHAQRRGCRARALLWLLGTAACAPLDRPAQPPAPGPEKPSAAVRDERARDQASKDPTGARVPLTAAEAAEVESLLRGAEQAIAADHLTYPSQGSALALYDRVRILDPDNDAARRGLERIVERYLELAMNAAEQRRFSEAQAMLDRSRLADPDHPGIGPTQARMRLLADAERRVIPLDGERLRERDPALTDSLHQAGMASRGQGCRAEITARNDSEGRWIYQQMSEAGGQARIQAQLNIGSPPRIEVLCSPEQP